MTHHDLTTEQKIQKIYDYLSTKFEDFIPKPEPEPEPEPTPEPAKPTQGFVKVGGWTGADLINREGWKPVNMKDRPTLFKIVDAAGKNIATDFENLANAQTYLDYYKAKKDETPGKFSDEIKPTEPTEPTEPPVPGGELDKEGIKIIYPTKAGGKEYGKTDFSYRRSIHDQSNEKNIPRDTFSINGVNFYQGEYTGVFKVDATNEDDDLSWKIGSKNHSGTDPNGEGQCYSFGIGFNGDPHLSKETPRHPTTPNFDNKCVVEPGMPSSFGNISGKYVGLKGILMLVDDNKNVLIECWIDNNPVDASGKLANNYKKWWTAKDTGNWKNPPQTDLAARPAMIYMRIDHVGAKTDMLAASCREIVPPTNGQ